MSNKLHNDEIENKANRLLNDTLSDLFRKRNYKLIENESGKGEIGQDYYYQIVERDTLIDEIFFINQNKGINKKIIPNKKSEKISYPLKNLRHPFSWYFKIAEPLVFTLCDIVSNKIYFYFIQNDETIPNRIAEQENKNVKNFQIYIPKENILDEQNFDRFLDEIRKARVSQIYKLNSSLFEHQNSDYSFIKKEIENLHIIDKLNYLVEVFECIKVFPKNILSELFYAVFGKGTYISEMTLNTDNLDLFNFAKSISKDKNKSYKLNDGKIYVDRQEIKLKSILEFFKVNLITHVDYGHRRLEEGNRVCIHKLFYYGVCNCERCTFESLDIKKAEKLLKIEHENYSAYQKLRKAYTFFLFGDVKNAIEVFLEIYNNCDKHQNPITYLIVKLNLLELKQFTNSWFYKDDETKVKLKTIGETFEDSFISEKAPHFLDIYKPLRDFRFVYRNIIVIDNLLLELQNNLLNDRNGGYTTNYKLTELISTFLRIHYFFEFNFILLNQYSEYKLLCRKILEGIFVIYNLKNPITEKYDFDIAILDMWIFNVKNKDAIFLLDQYKIKNIRVKSISSLLRKLNNYIDNLTKSILSLNKNSENNDLHSKLENITKNIYLIVSKLDIDEVELNKLFSKFLDFNKSVKINKLIQFDDLIRIVYQNEKIISKANIHNFILYIQETKSNVLDFSYLSKLYFEKASQQEIIEIITLLNGVERIEDLNFSDSFKYGKYWYGFDFLDENLKTILKQKITSILSNNFNSELFDMATVFDTIDFDDNLFDIFLSKIPNLSKNSERHFFHQYENIQLDQAINICYKFNIAFDKVRKYAYYNVASKIEYYKWLMDLDNFDYSKFNPYWLIENNLKYYIEAFRKSKSLINFLENYLKNDFDSDIAQYYFKNLKL